MFNLIMFSISFAVLASIFRGWVLTILWDWFIVPLGVPHIGIATALGIVIIVNMLTQHLDTKPEKKYTDDASLLELLVQAFAKSFLSPLVTLALGAIISSFI